ncbi:hypothetical protein X734_29580 [Mesorhizobium sp. L2C084A000]|nr:hypothetical protein X734_29580 [Mesorhizobium sp. L2C084A000]
MSIQLIYLIIRKPLLARQDLAMCEPLLVLMMSLTGIRRKAHTCITMLTG